MCSGISLSECDRLILRSYQSIVDGLAEFWGGGIEIVLHSLEDLAKAAIKVVNGRYIGRKEGVPITDLALRMLREIGNSNDCHKNLICFNHNSAGVPIRSATLPITGEHDRVFWLLCINFYLNTPLHAFLAVCLRQIFHIQGLLRPLPAVLMS